MAQNPSISYPRLNKIILISPEVIDKCFFKDMSKVLVMLSKYIFTIPAE